MDVELPLGGRQLCGLALDEQVFSATGVELFANGGRGRERPLKNVYNETELVGTCSPGG